MNSRLAILTRPLLFLVLFNLLPQLWLRPLWVVGFSFGLLAYRYWLDLRNSAMPPRLAIFAAQVAVALSVWGTYHSFFGDEAGGTLLTLLACLKVYELRRKRDYFMTVILCTLVLMSDLLLDQGLLISIYLLADLALIVTYMYALQLERWSWGAWRADLRSAFMLILKTLPLAAITFLLFPRFSTGFGLNPNSTARTGVSDSLSPGSVSRLVQSDELIFRASFLHGDMPPQSQLYWRAAVLDQSNGLNWNRSRPGGANLRPVVVPNNPDVEIYLEPGSNRFLFSMDNTQNLAFPNVTNSTRTESRGGRTFQLVEPLQTRERYYLQNGSPQQDPNPDLSKYLQTSEPPSKQVGEFLKKFSGLSAPDTVRRLLDEYRSDGFHYSLSPPRSRSVEEFLFKTKTGFCEHFAGSMGTLLRYLKIPARVVVGFQGGTTSLLDNYVSVRGHDAHAWVEYYDTQTKRWYRVDPTAEVAPQRLTVGAESYFDRQHSFVPSWLPGDWTKVYLKTRALMDEVEAGWTGFLLHFDLARQKELLAKLGIEEVLFRALPVFLILSLALILAVLYFFEAQRREPLAMDERLYRRLLEILKRLRIEKQPNEGPLELFRRVQSTQPQLAEEISPIMHRLILARYGREPLTWEAVETVRHQLKRLKYWIRRH